MGDNPISMASCYEPLTLEACNARLQTIVGLPVSRVWCGYGNALFLELGALSMRDRHRHPSGQICIRLETDWRIDRQGVLVVNLEPDAPDLEDRAKKLEGNRVSSLVVMADIHDLIVHFSDDSRLWAGGSKEDLGNWGVHIHDVSIMALDPVWQGVAVTPIIGAEDEQLAIQYCFGVNPYVGDVRAGDDEELISKLRAKYIFE